MLLHIGFLSILFLNDLESAVVTIDTKPSILSLPPARRRKVKGNNRLLHAGLETAASWVLYEVHKSYGQTSIWTGSKMDKVSVCVCVCHF